MPNGIGHQLLICPFLVLCQVLLSFAIIPTETIPTSHPKSPFWAVLLALCLYIPLHELMHLVWYPNQGFSNQSILVLWPRKLRFGVYYDGYMSRTRWLLMRLAPFVVISLFPATFLGIFQVVLFSHDIRTFLEVLTIVNGVGSGADVIAILLVLFQVPASVYVYFRGGGHFGSQNYALAM